MIKFHINFTMPPVWVRVSVLISVMSILVCGLVYGTVQHSIRSDANNPQIQIVEDITAALNSGAKPTDILGASGTDMGQALDTFAQILDDKGNILASSAVLNGAPKTVPTGVLDYVKAHGQDRLTWQPTSTVRIAAVVGSYNGGYVVAGKNLREVEKTENDTATLAAAGLVAMIIGSFILSFLLLSEKK